MFKLFCLLAILPLVVSLESLQSYPIVRCDNNAATPIAIRIDGCPGPICQIRRGGVVTYEVDFWTNSAGSTINIQMLVPLGAITISLPLLPPRDNGCINLTVGSCPYQYGQTMRHRSSIPVPMEIPAGFVATILVNYQTPTGTLFCAKVQGYAV